MPDIPGRIDSVTGMLSELHLLRNPPGSWLSGSALNPRRQRGTIPLDLLWHRNRLGQHEVCFPIARQFSDQQQHPCRIAQRIDPRWTGFSRARVIPELTSL